MYEESQQKLTSLFKKGYDIIERIINQFSSVFKQYKCRYGILSSHRKNKVSIHLIIRLTNNNGVNYMFKNMSGWKILFEKYFKGFEGVDDSVYKKGGGLFRTICSYKITKNYSEVKRRFIRDSFEKRNKNLTSISDIECFVVFSHEKCNLFNRNYEQTVFEQSVSYVQSVFGHGLTNDNITLHQTHNQPLVEQGVN